MKTTTRSNLSGSVRQHGLKVGLAALLLAAIVPLFFSGPVFSQDKRESKGAAKREMCITFDELPVAKSFGDVDRQAVTYLILQALKKHDVKAAGFVVGDQIEGSYDILGEWLNDGHVLGNMTFSNQDLNELGPEQFIDDIGAGHDALEQMLAGFGQKHRYFRYPYLHYGTSIEAKRQVTGFLNEHNYKVAHVSVVIEDYLYNLSLDKLGKTPDSAQYESLLTEYVNHVIQAIQQSEATSMDLLNHPCRQILALKANRLNAVSLDIILSAIENMGYRFVTLDRALADPVYSTPEAYFGSKGIGYLEMLQQSDADLLPAQ